tara:strand:+ start:258 stop:449 length:192 start_codon:yes stop_codon:yes gene_type:complete
MREPVEHGFLAEITASVQNWNIAPNTSRELEHTRTSWIRKSLISIPKIPWKKESTADSLLRKE